MAEFCCLHFVLLCFRFASSCISFYPSVFHLLRFVSFRFLFRLILISVVLIWLSLFGLVFFALFAFASVHFNVCLYSWLYSRCFCVVFVLYNLHLFIYFLCSYFISIFSSSGFRLYFSRSRLTFFFSWRLSYYLYSLYFSLSWNALVLVRLILWVVHFIFLHVLARRFSV